MHDSRPILGPHMDIDWPQHNIVLNRVLLVAALGLAVLGVSSLLVGQGSQWSIAGSLALAMIASAVWLLVAYVASRAGRAWLSGWLLVLFGLVWLGILLYVLPGYTLALLPAALLPVGLAVLLLDGRAVMLTVILAIATVLTLSFATLPPAPAIVSELPLAPLAFGLVVTSLTIVLLPLMLLPLRGAHTVLTRRFALQSEEMAHTVAERIAAEQARDAALDMLARQRQHLEALADSIRDGVIGVDANGQVVRANAVARQIYSGLASNDSPAPSLDVVEQALVSRPNDLAPVDLLPLPNFDLAPDAAYTHLLIDRREEARLARLRGELLGLLTDEMRNPLTSMVTALDLTLGQQDLPEEIDRVLIGARQSGQRLLELVTMLLEISQFEQRADVLRRSSMSLSRVIESGIAQMSPLAQHGAVTVTVEHAGESVVEVDGDRVQRAFNYLLEQALRQGPPYSVVQVRTRRAENEIVVQITDQGPGRTAQGDSLRQGGDERAIASLGLIYSRLVIEAHGGRVWLESNGGQGTSYSLALPLGRQELLSG